MVSFLVIAMPYKAYEFLPAEITAMKYAYRELLAEFPERYPEISDKQQLARSVIKSMETIRLGPGEDMAELVITIMADDDV